jgi:flagellar operon protein
MTSPVQNPALVSPALVTPSAPASPASSAPLSGPTFAAVLQSTGGVPAPRFSRHALDRLRQRGIQLSQSMLDRLTHGVSRAAGKGSRDSVVFVDGTAYVVSVSNNTVITAVGSEHMREHVFTNIDSAVIA